LEKLIRGWLISIFIFFPLFWSFGLPASKTENVNVLLVNSYHRGYQWTDSLNAGIQRILISHPEITLYTTDLDAKKFSQLKFDLDKKYIEERYAGIKFSGIIVTDNDALDFMIKYKESLFPKIPIVFAGISNPKDYHLEGTEYFGFEESVNSDSILYLIKKILPSSKKIMILVDNTTTGKVYQNEFSGGGKNYHDLKIDFSDSINIDSICNLNFAERKYDAAFYTALSQDVDGSFIDPEIAMERIVKTINVPLFSNDPKYLSYGILGGTFQSGILHGEMVMELLINLINSNDRSSFKHVNHTKYNFFFDDNELVRYNIPISRLPKGSIIYNQRESFFEENLFLLLLLIGILTLSVIILSVVNRHRNILHRKSIKSIQDIENQKKELQDAHEKLSVLITELETANQKLNESNIELLKAKKKAEESDNLKSAFLANVSHEIRTPLNSIVGFSSLLNDPSLDNEIRNSYIGLIDSNTESLLVLIDEIMDLSKIEAQQLTLKMQDFSIDALMEELFAIFNHGHKNQSVELRIIKTDPNKELFVFSDRVRVKQVFVNLLTNALKFTDSGFVEMGYSLLDNNEIAIYVKDTGIGIRKEHQEAIFHRFRKLNDNSGKIYRGTGLGLAITKKLVELLGGRIWIESESGKGSFFQFTLGNCMLR